MQLIAKSLAASGAANTGSFFVPETAEIGRRLPKQQIKLLP